MQWGAGGPRRCTSQPDHDNLRRSFAKRRKAAQGHHNRYRAKTDHPCQRPVQNPSEMGVIANLIDTVASTAAVRVLESLIFDDRSDFTAAFGLAECESHLVALCHRSEEHTSELQSLMRISYSV